MPDDEHHSGYATFVASGLSQGWLTNTCQRNEQSMFIGRQFGQNMTFGFHTCHDEDPPEIHVAVWLKRFSASSDLPLFVQDFAMFSPFFGPLNTLEPVS